MAGVERVQPLPAQTVRCFAVMGARSVVFESKSSAGARGAGGGSGTIGPRRGGGDGDRNPAQQLSGPDGWTILAEFPLENAGRHRPLSRGPSEGRRSVDPIVPDRDRAETHRVAREG